MKVTIKQDKSHGVSPPILTYLASFPEGEFYYLAQGLRHPYGITSVALSRVWEAMSKATSLLGELHTEAAVRESVGETYLQVLRHQLELFYALESMEDSFKSLLKGMFKNNEVAQKNQHFREFMLRSKGFRDKLGRTVNAIKHDNCSLQPVMFLNFEKGGFRVAPGFFVEGVLSDGAIGPSPKVHADGNSGFSLVRELRYYFVHAYFLAHWAEQAIRQIVGPRMFPVVEKAAQEDLAESIARDLIASRLWMFPDEGLKKLPEIEFLNTGEVRGMRLSFERSSKVPALSGGRVMAQWKGDGVSKSFKPPYFGHPAARGKAVE